MQPTVEQGEAVELFAGGLNLAIEAGAGTGKTSTLVMLGEAAPYRRGQYVAFNKAIVVDAGSKMPHNVQANTAHSLAFRSTGRRFAHRLDSGRMRSSDIARLLKLEPIFVTGGQGEVGRMLQPGFLASTVVKTITRFCQSADCEPKARHMPFIEGIDLPDDVGRRTFENNLAVAQQLLPAMHRAWGDLCDENGRLPYKPDHYLKLWQLSDPKVGAEFILFDEAQDAAPVMLAAIEAQTDAQLVFVGDSQQQIYEWRGAVNALEQVHHDARSFLTQSWRFGQPIADAANLVLDQLGAELRLTGHPEMESKIAAHPAPAAILTRTNACAVSTVLDLQRMGRLVHLVGGAAEVTAFTRAAGELQAGHGTSYYDLACFNSWVEVQEYVGSDPQGDDLRLLARLVDDYSVPVILKALEHMPAEDHAEIVVSTAHKAKGREWPTVRLAADFDTPAVDALGEWRLLYVAATRAREVLDVSMCAPLADLLAVPTEQLLIDNAGGKK